MQTRSSPLPPTMQGQYHQQPNMHPVHGGQQQQYGQQMPPPPPQQYYSNQQQGVYAQPPQSPGAYGSHPTLPRYASQTSMGPSSPSLSPLNPSAQQYHHQHRGGPSPTNSYTSSNPSSHNNYPSSNSNANGLGSRFSSYGYANGGPGAQGGAHPLSHALYADSPSSPTLAGDVDDISDEKKGLGSFPPSSSASSGGDSRSSNNRRLNAGNKGYESSGLSGAYKRWSGAFIADSGVDERHRKPERIGWLDGLRFFAAWLVINGTFFDATIGNSDVGDIPSIIILSPFLV